MGILDRMSSLFKSNVNAAIDKVSDPGKQVEQLILEMEEQERLARGETVTAKATQKRAATRITELEKEVRRWTERAEAALNAGDEGLARSALERREAIEADLLEARREHKEAAQYAEELEAALAKLGARVREYRMKKGTIKAKASMGKRHTTVDSSTDAFDDFQRMSDKVEDGEAAVEAEAALADLSTTEKDAEVEQKFKKLAAHSSVDDRLAALKKKLEK
jgi:phage shock protein A